MFKLIPRLGVLIAIRIYQKTISLDHGLPKHLFPNGYCQFHPTCSEYGYQAIDRYGIIKGGLLAAWRVLRCHPWSPGGIDQVPVKEIKK